MELESSPTGQGSVSNARTVFCCFAPRRRSSWWERVRSTSHQSTVSTGDRWWSRGVRALKKLREWSEIVAGPRWKTFIRSINRNHRNCKRMSNNYQYDPLSYALNFDEGQNGEFQHSEAYDGFRNFSTRYAVAVPNVNVNVNANVKEEEGKDKDVVVSV